MFLCTSHLTYTICEADITCEATVQDTEMVKYTHFNARLPGFKFQLCLLCDLSKLLNFSVPQFHHPNEYNHRIYFIDLL